MSKKSEKVSQKSAAEFFSEHQQIAGFDNPGTSVPSLFLPSLKQFNHRQEPLYNHPRAGRELSGCSGVHPGRHQTIAPAASLTASVAACRCYRR